MGECFKCGKSDQETVLFNVISREGIQKICRFCQEDERLPIIKTTTEEEIKKIEENEQSERCKRLSNMSGVGYKKGPGFEVKPARVENKIYDPQKEELRKLVNKNTLNNFEPVKTPEGVIEHFHWAIMRKRKSKKFTPAQLAEKVRESEATIRMIEKGNLPRGYLEILKKIERELDVHLLEENFRRKIDVETPKSIDFERRNFDEIRIADLHEMEGQEEIEIDYSEDEDGEEAVSRSWIRDLIFRRR